MIRTRLLAMLFIAAGLILPGVALAHGPANDGAKPKKSAAAPEQKPWGVAGDPRKATRTVKIDMRDEMEYIPSLISVKQGDTVRFVVSNSGRIMHELVIGTKPELEAHAALMKKFPEMEHEEAYMAHVPPGKTESIVWRFNRAGEFYYACLVAGHYEAGMVGKVIVKP
jgi:uncharacterized cupredoxin-like copper-binding protein